MKNILFVAFVVMGSLAHATADIKCTCTIASGRYLCNADDFYKEYSDAWAVYQCGHIVQCFDFKADDVGTPTDPVNFGKSKASADAVAKKLESVGACTYLGQKEN